MNKVAFCIVLLFLGKIYAMDPEKKRNAFLAKEIDTTCCCGLCMVSDDLPFFKNERRYDESESKHFCCCCCYDYVELRLLRACYEAETERNVVYSQRACCWDGTSKKAPLTDDGYCLCYAWCGLLQRVKKKKPAPESVSACCFLNGVRSSSAELS